MKKPAPICALIASLLAPPLFADVAAPIRAGGFLSPESYPGMSLHWQDEFGGSSLDSAAWLHQAGPGTGKSDNREAQDDLPENTAVREGYLVITARADPNEYGKYTSSRIVTRGRRQVTFGRVDIRASLPAGQGVRTALGLSGVNISDVGWPRCGEIEIMEMIGGQGREDTVHGTLHWQANGQSRFEGGSLTLPNDTFTGQFHVFSVVWDASRIRWLVDNRVYHERDIAAAEFDAFRKPFFFSLALDIGGERSGPPDPTTGFPKRLVVDYIRVFQASPQR